MTQRTLIRFGILLGLSIVALILYARKSPPPAGVSPNPEPVRVLTGETITFGTAKGGVTVKNFFDDAVQISDEGVLIVQTDQYAIDYFQPQGTFSVIVTAQSPDARAAAEAGFLSALHVSQQDACLLRVTVRNSWEVASAPLSFCSSGVQ